MRRISVNPVNDATFNKEVQIENHKEDINNRELEASDLFWSSIFLIIFSLLVVVGLFCSLIYQNEILVLVFLVSLLYSIKTTRDYWQDYKKSCNNLEWLKKLKLNGE